MADNNFTINNLRTKFNIKFRFENIFKEVKEIEPSSWLLQSLDVGQFSGFVTKKARSERLISPVLMELFKNNKQGFTIYSGMNMDIDSEKGLRGECDFILSHSTVQDFVTAPVFSIVEAKRQDVEKGTIQCAAQLLGAKILNEQEGTPLTSPIYGCSTTGTEWRFLKLEGNPDCFGIVIDVKRYYLAMPAQLLGVLQTIIDDTKPKKET